MTATRKVEDAAKEAHRTVVETSTSGTTAYVLEVLGQKLAAHMLNVDPKTLRRWAAGESDPRGEAEGRLRDLHMILRLLNRNESPQTVRAWFVGLNPQLNDLSPAEAVRGGRLREVLTAAKSFLAGG
jgi:hypothetical protein